MRYITLVLCSLTLEFLSQCTPKTEKTEAEFLISFSDEEETEFGYKTPEGDTVIPLGKYDMCFTDTFKTFAIVANKSGFVAIDRNEKVLYQVFNYDNGPDYPSNGLFRIIENGKIGYADEATGKIVIKAQYPCAWPFENGKAQVSTTCTQTPEGEHTKWESDTWIYIDEKGGKVK